MTHEDTTPEVDTPEEVETPTLDLELPEYHGRQPVGMKTSLTGAGNRLARSHGIGDRVVLVVEAKVKRAGHEDTDDGLIYAETLKVADLFEVHGDPGARLLSTLRSAYRTAKDDLDGKAPIPQLGDVGYTDGAGVVLTDREVAALRGDDPIRALVSDDLTPVVVIYDDASRLLWPEEYDTGTARPAIGETVFVGDGAHATVVDLLHHATGESLVDATSYDVVGEPWTDEDARATLAGEIPDDDPILNGDDGGGVSHEKLGIIPGDVDPDSYDMTADDGIEPFEKPDPVDEVPPLPGEIEAEKILPTTADFVFVDVSVPKLRERLSEVADEILLRRFLEAEKQGRGRGLRYRKSALDAIRARLAEIGAE